MDSRTLTRGNDVKTRGFMAEYRMRKFWEKMFKNSLRIGAYRIEDINDTWAVMRDGQLPEDTTYDTQQDAVDYAVLKVVAKVAANLDQGKPNN